MGQIKKLLNDIDDLDFLDEEYQYQEYLKQQQKEMELDFIINEFFCN